MYPDVTYFKQNKTSNGEGVNNREGKTEIRCLRLHISASYLRRSGSNSQSEKELIFIMVYPDRCFQEIRYIFWPQPTVLISLHIHAAEKASLNKVKDNIEGPRGKI